MGARIGQSTREYIENAPLPTHGQTYTVISHKFVIDEVTNGLKAAGFEIQKELYRCNQNAEIACGVYFMNYGDDPDMGLMMAWVNSYDKSLRFRCAIGGHIFSSGNRIISGSAKESWSRKHTGTADQQAQEMIKRHVDNAADYYQELVSVKQQMKEIKVDLKTSAELVGRLFLEKNALNAEQVQMIKVQMRGDMKFDYKCEPDSLWALYNHIAYALQKSHPRKWLDQQVLMHNFLCDHFNVKWEKPETPEPVSPVPEQVTTETVAEPQPEVVSEEQVNETPVEIPVTLDEQPVEQPVEEMKEEPEAEKEMVAEQPAKTPILEDWLLGECQLLGVEIDRVNKFLYFREDMDISDEIYNASVELGWTIQPALPFPVEP